MTEYHLYPATVVITTGKTHYSPAGQVAEPGKALITTSFRDRPISFEFREVIVDYGESIHGPEEIDHD